MDEQWMLREPSAWPGLEAEEVSLPWGLNLTPIPPTSSENVPHIFSGQSEQSLKGLTPNQGFVSGGIEYAWEGILATIILYIHTWWWGAYNEMYTWYGCMNMGIHPEFWAMLMVKWCFFPTEIRVTTGASRWIAWFFLWFLLFWDASNRQWCRVDVDHCGHHKSLPDLPVPSQA